jgi:chromosome segregation ATPase
MAHRTTHQLATSTLVPFAQASLPQVELWTLTPVQAPQPAAQPVQPDQPIQPVQPVAVESRNAEPAAPGGAIDTQHQLLALKQKLEEAVGECEQLQSSLTSQQQLEQLLLQGRTHLHDLRARLQHMTAERDRLQIELSERQTEHQHESERLQIQLGEMTNAAFLQRMLAEQRERDMRAKQQDQQQQIDALDEQLQHTVAERDGLAAQLEQDQAAYRQFADERADERYTFERLLAEATSNQRDMVQELDEKRQQLETLREAAIRAQSLAREIMRAHEKIPVESLKF